MLTNVLDTITLNKNGVEIGGPSLQTGTLLYKNALNFDNVVFSNKTVWSSHDSTYQYYPGKHGKMIINDGVCISDVTNEVYDFLFASHCLEHIANPLKALYEWLRIIKTGGYIILILPEKSRCFDRTRNVTELATLIKQYQNNVGEDDLSSLHEILTHYDLNIDYGGGTFVEFIKRSLDNFNNRCLHHYVYSPELLKQICEYINCEFIFTETHGLDIWFIIRKK